MYNDHKVHDADHPELVLAIMAKYSKTPFRFYDCILDLLCCLHLNTSPFLHIVLLFSDLYTLNSFVTFHLWWQLIKLIIIYDLTIQVIFSFYWQIQQISPFWFP